MKKSYKILCVFVSVALILSCFVFSVSADFIAPNMYGWTGKQIFDNTKDKKMFFNSGNQYLSASVRGAGNLLGNKDYPKYRASVPTTLEPGNSFSIFFSFMTLPEAVKVEPEDYIHFTVPTFMANNEGFTINQIAVSFRGTVVNDDGSTGPNALSYYEEEPQYTYVADNNNYFEMSNTVDYGFQYKGKEFEVDTLVVIYYGNFDTATVSSYWDFGFRNQVTFYAGDLDNYPFPLDEYVPGQEAIAENAALENDIRNATAAGKDQAEEILSGFGNVVGNDTSLFKGISAVTNIMNVGLGVPFIGDIIQFALALGMFSFVVGMGFLYNKARSNRSAKNEYSNRGGGS